MIFCKIKRLLSPRAWLLIILPAALLITGVFVLISEIPGNRVVQPASSSLIPAEWGLSAAELVWVRNRMIMYSKLGEWNPIVVTPGENPRWSPNGSKIVFTRGHDVWMMNHDFSEIRQIISNVVTELGAGAFWTSDGRGLTVINRNNPRQVLFYDLQTGRTGALHDEDSPPFRHYRFSQSAQLRTGGRYLLTFTEDVGHRSMIIDLQGKKYIANDFMKDGDCEPAWAPNGTFLVTTRRARQRPVYRTDFDAASGMVSDSQYLIGAGRSHWPSISNDSQYVVYSDHTNIYIWRVGLPVSGMRHGIQLTSTSGKNISPNLYVSQEGDK